MSVKQLNVLLSVVLGLVIVAAVIISIKNLGLRHDLGITSGQLRRSIKSEQIKRDSIHELEARLEVLKMSMAHKVMDLRDSLKAERVNSTKWKANYVREKNYRVPADISDAGLDSLITGLVTN